MTTEQDKKWILIDFIKDTLGLEKTGVLRGLDYKVLHGSVVVNKSGNLEIFKESVK